MINRFENVTNIAGPSTTAVSEKEGRLKPSVSEGKKSKKAKTLKKMVSKFY